MKLATWLSTANIFPKTTSFRNILITEGFSKKKKEIFEKYSPQEIFNILKSVDVNGMELVVIKSTTDKEIKTIQQLSKQNNFPILSIHQPLANFLSISFKEIERLFEIAHNVSARVVVLHISSVYKQIQDHEFLALLKQLENKYSIVVGIENMPKNILVKNQKPIWEPKHFTSLISQNDCKITLDTTHLGEVEGNLIDFYKANKKRIVNIHISDYKNHRVRNKLSLTSGRHLALGDGELPIEQFLQTLKKDNYQGLMTMEINSSLEKLSNSAKLIRSILN